MCIGLRKIAIVTLVLLCLGGCSTVRYYSQSVTGHMKVWSKRQDIDMLLQSDKVNEQLRKRLELVKEIRRFATRELLLPDNYSFKSYVDIKRDNIVYNVVAAPEFSVMPKKWCFPVLGCLNYKGYFAKNAALAHARKLKKQGYDVTVGGVTAYSTLGWFADPVLNTFVKSSESDLAGIIFHELAHQVVYIKGDTTFNESFATAVELAGIERWMRYRKKPSASEKYTQKKKYESEFIRFALSYRRRLKSLYALPMKDSEKRKQKKKIFAQMQSDYKKLVRNWSGYKGFDGWMSKDLNNASLSTLATYYNHVEAFSNLLAQHKSDMKQFFLSVKRIGAMDKPQRELVLKNLRNRARALSYTY